MPTIECNQQRITFDQPVTVAQALARLLPESHDKPLGAFCEGRVLELGSRLTQDTTLRPITFQDEEGRRIYERSLRFILLLAVHRCYPDVRVRIEHSIGFGMYLQLVGRRVVQGDAKLIEDTMREITCYAEPKVLEAQSGERFQFFRHGYFVADSKLYSEDNPVFNEIIGLKSSWKK